RPVRADLERLQRETCVVDRTRRAGEVVHEVDRLLDLEVLRDVVVHEQEVVSTQVLHVLERAGVEIVHADDTEVLRDEVIAEMGAEKAGPTRDDGGRHRREMLPIAPDTRRSLYEGFTEGWAGVGLLGGDAAAQAPRPHPRP